MAQNRGEYALIHFTWPVYHDQAKQGMKRKLQAELIHSEIKQVKFIKFYKRKV